MGLPPSRKVTIPVGVPTAGGTPVTVAVKVTGCPKTDGFCEEVTVVVVLPFATVITAVEVLPVPAVVSVTVTLLLTVPAPVPCTVTETVQLAPAARLAPERDTDEEPSAAVAVPLQVLLRFPGVATISVAGAAVGRLSVNAMPFSVMSVFGLLMLKVNEVVPPSGIVPAPKLLVIVGAKPTVTVAEAVSPPPASLQVTALVVLFCGPTLMPFTFTENVHTSPEASVAPLRLTLVPPSGAVIVPPPQLPLKPLGVESTSPAGRVSVNPMTVRVVAKFGLLRVKVSEVVPFNGMWEAPNALSMVGG